MIWKRRKEIALDVALLTAAALLLLAYVLTTSRQYTGGELGPPLDDAWIHYQFARNLSQGHGFSFNPGEPTPGSTAPLWTLLLAPIGWFTERFIAPSLALSALFLLAAAGLAYGLARELTGARWPGLLAGLGTLAAGRLLWAGLAGMETTAFAALSLAGIWAYQRQGLRPLPALLLALAAQLRPEGHALFALLLADAFVFGREDKLWHWLRQALLPLLLYVAVSLPYVIFSLSTTGRLLPNTFYAKASTGGFFSWRTLRETVAYHWRDNPVSLVLAALGIWPLLRRSRLTAAWLLSLPLFTAVVIDFTWHHGRYTMPLIPVQMVVAAVGAWWLGQRLAERWPRGETAVAGLLLTALLVGGLWGVPRWAVMHGNNAREIIDIDVALGHWLAANTPPEALIAVDDIGAITYLSERRIVDMNGLVSPEVWSAVRLPERAARSRELTRILSESRPDYMAAFPLWRWEIATNPVVALERHRVSTPTHTIIFQQDAYVYEMVWPYLETTVPQRAIGAELGEGIVLQGVDTALVADVANAGAAYVLSLTLYWESVAPVPVDYDVFVHVVDDGGQIVVQADRQPVDGLAATSVWRPGDVVGDPLELLLPAALPAGWYEVRVGMYLRETGARLPVRQLDTAVGDSVGVFSFSLPAE